MQYQGYIAGGVVVLDSKAELPEGTRVLIVPVVETPAPTLADRFQKVISKATGLPDSMGLPPGAPPESLLRMAGSIPIADCVEMEQAIEEGCGQVNANAW